MGVLIKNMTMPKNCDECRFRSGAWCTAIDNWRKGYNKPPTGERLDECPLVELPPHGRLIDGDALFDKMYYADGEPETVSEHINNIVHFMSTLASMPTIIGAEDG